MTSKKDLISFYYSKIAKSLNHLEYSYHRALKLPTETEALSESQFETWDGFSARFARSSDLFLSKYIKAFIQNDDPAFDGGFRDFLNRSEKLGLIDNAYDWLEIRNMRNVVVHEYSEKDLEAFFKKLLLHTPKLLELRKKLANAPERS